LLLLGGTLGDRIGQKRIFVVGLVGFMLTSGLCGLAFNMAWLVGARAFQGVSAALLTPGSLALLRTRLHPQDQNEAVGYWAGLSGVTTAIGPLLGGWLVEAVSWRLIFFINLPLAAFAIVLALRTIPPDKERESVASLDYKGAVCAAGGLGTMLWALIEAGPRGLNDPWVLSVGAFGMFLLILFFMEEKKAVFPMLPLQLFHSRQFCGANLVTLSVYFGLGGATFLLALQFQQTLGYSPLQAGSALLPVTLLLLVLSPWAGRLATRVGFRFPMTCGPFVAALGFSLLAAHVVPGASYLRDILPGVGVMGLGLALTVAPLTSATISSVDLHYAGVAAAINTAVARIASLLAVALLPLAAGMAKEEGGLAFGFTYAMRTSAFMCLIGGITAFVMVSGKPCKRSRREPKCQDGSPRQE
jgi:EmrB/QacA subfamily drug resistance transporter